MRIEHSNHRALNFKIYLVVGVLYLLLWPILVAAPIGSSSEAREVHVARVIFETGEWIAPRRAGFAPSKPPLYHWIVATVGHVVGYVDEKVARSVSLLFGMLLLALTMRITVALKPDNISHKSNYKLALLSGVILLTTYQFLRLCGDTRVDMTFSYFVVAAIAVLLWPIARLTRLESELYLRYKSSDLNAFYVACGVAVLAKGPLGLALPFVIGYSIVTSQIGFLKCLKLFVKPCLGWIIFPLIALPWYFLSATRGGGDFILRQIVFENIERFSGGVYITREPIWYYIPSFVSSAFPWSLLFFILILNFRTNPKTLTCAPYPISQSTSNNRLIPIIWVIVGISLFSLSAGKRHSYLLPLFPAVAIFLSWSLLSWNEALSATFKHKLTLFLWRLYYVLLALTLFLVGIVFLLPLVDFTYSESLSISINWLVANNIFIAGPLLFVFVGSLILCGKREQFHKQYSTVLFLPLLAVIGGVAVFTPLAIKNNLKGFNRMAQDIDILLAKGAKIYVIRKREEELLDPLLFYLKRDVVVIETPLNKLECGSYYIFQYLYLENVKNSSEESGKAIFIKGRYQQVLDHEHNKRDREIYLAYLDCN